jgi:hypothetical protein
MTKKWIAGVTRHKRASTRKAKTADSITRQDTISQSFFEVAQSFNPTLLQEADLNEEIPQMSCCDCRAESDYPEECDYQIDYSTVTIEDRIIPFKFELDLALSMLDPPPGQNQRFCYRVTGVGENISTYQSLSHWVLSLNPDISLSQITNVQVIVGGVPQTVIIGANVDLYIPPDTDSATGCSGLKFDFALNKVLNAPDSSGLFCFELNTTYPLGSLSVCVTSRQVHSSALSICGPAWLEV